MGRRGSATHRQATHRAGAPPDRDALRRRRCPPAGRTHRPDQGATAVPSGSLGLDLATGVDGLPRGRLTELLGPPSSGKTALLYGALAVTQRAGGLAALIDAEGSADGDALTACGVDLDELLLARPASARDALLLLTILARCGGLDTLGVASIAALRDLPPPATAPDALGDLRSHDVARLLSRGLRVLMAALRWAARGRPRRGQGFRHPGATPGGVGEAGATGARRHADERRHHGGRPGGARRPTLAPFRRDLRTIGRHAPAPGDP